MATMATAPVVRDQEKGRREREDEQGEEEGGGTSRRRNSSGATVDGARSGWTGPDRRKRGQEGTGPAERLQREKEQGETARQDGD
jgi:hypothetical protein